jgi:pimeloyl-ACP methyl ester carboxylesterase
VLVIGCLLAILFAAGALYQLIGARIGARKYSAPGRMIDVAGQRLHLVCAGHGSPNVLFESGIAASSLSWTRVLREVASFTRACAYDRAGLGWSAPVRAPRTVATMLRELRGVLAHARNGEPSVLVGHSFGAFLVCAYASRYPAEVAGLVLLDPPSEWRAITREQSRMLRGGIVLSRIGGLLARIGVVRGCLALLTGGAPGVPRNFVRIFGPTAARTVERLVGEVRKLPPEVYPVVQMHWCQPKCFRSMADHLAALEQTAAVASGVTSLQDVPLVVISAGDQPAEVLAVHRQLARLSSLGRHVVATGSGHWVQFDAPDLVVGTIRSLVTNAT